MEPETIKLWSEIVINIATLIAAFVGGLWAYTKFIVERGLQPPVEFTYAITGLNQWLLTSWVRTPLALVQLLVFPPQEPFVHPRTERRFEDRDSQLAFTLLDGAIR
jgi:hypothetical protein